MARAKSTAMKVAATSKTWVYKPGGRPMRADDPEAPKDWTIWTDEGDPAWWPRGQDKGDADGKP